MAKKRRESPWLQSSLARSLARAKARARARGITCEITSQDIRDMLHRQGTRCALSGIEFDPEDFDGAYVKNPMAPSIDRINPAEGYTRGNSRLVLTAVNFALNEWGDNLFRMVALGVAKRDASWMRRLKRRLNQAETEARSLAGAALKTKLHSIAGLKAALAKGSAGTKAAARLAATRRKL